MFYLKNTTWKVTILVERLFPLPHRLLPAPPQLLCGVWWKQVCCLCLVLQSFCIFLNNVVFCKFILTINSILLYVFMTLVSFLKCMLVHSYSSFFFFFTFLIFCDCRCLICCTIDDIGVFTFGILLNALAVVLLDMSWSMCWNCEVVGQAHFQI